jgi:UDP-glucose 4-epimerase
MCEQILRDQASANPALKVAILRYFNPVGAHPSSLIGEDPSGVPNNLMPFISQVAAGERAELSIFGGDYETKDGTGVRDYLHVVDLAKGHLAALDYLSDHSGAFMVNLGTGVGYSVLDLVKAFSEVNNIEIPYKIIARRAGDLAEFYADPSRAENLLGWKAELSLREMCRDSWNWQSKNPEGYK